MIPNDRSPGRTTQGPINFAPSSRDAGLGYATRWYCIIQKTSHRRPNELPHELHLSDDGGATWRLVRPLASATFGSIGHLVVDPVDPGVVYVNSGEGLWRFDAADRADGPVTRLSGTGGLPEGGVGDRLYLGPDGRTSSPASPAPASTAATTPGRAGRSSRPTPTCASCTSTPGTPSG